jgi:hypothetical protein
MMRAGVYPQGDLSQAVGRVAYQAAVVAAVESQLDERNRVLAVTVKRFFFDKRLTNATNGAEGDPVPASE